MSNSLRIPARITAVETQESGGAHADSVFVTFEHNDRTRKEDFGSPLLNGDNILLWRRLVLSVVLDERVPADDNRFKNFSAYKSNIEGQNIYIAYDGREVFALGRDPKNMFFPHEYGLWDLPPEDGAPTA